MLIPQGVGSIHFVGIGGIGMSGIAEVLHNTGYQVQGSDVILGSNVQRLHKQGIKVSIGHKEENIGNAEILVVSTAIDKDNVECVAARERNIPIIYRSEMLAGLMRARKSISVSGTHGKTTTTSLIAALLEQGNLDPTVINGGIVNSYGTNARIGTGEWIVVEADESDGTFIKLPSDIVVVTNIDPEHLDYYSDFDAIRAAFYKFIDNIPFYGFAVVCLDHPEVLSLVARIQNRKIITYGQHPQADVCYSNIRKYSGRSIFDVTLQGSLTQTPIEIKDLVLPLIGNYNISNASAAIAIAHRLGLSSEDIAKGLAGFSGIKRRFTLIGIWNDVHIFDDYGHHPVEISAVLSAVRQICPGKVIAIHQPHRYTRLSTLFDQFSKCFVDSDTVLISPVYAAGEKVISGFSSQELVQKIKESGHPEAYYLDSFDHLVSKILDVVEPGDFIIFFGAGNITQWAASLIGELELVTEQKNVCMM
ncbi:UDP-N-acetylmuramate--L-alanine ligase [Candidatus Liberibacter solanacearum]|uniref:UDP-N-acetylmuramate--L-alanine ligase n=1 Tax=Candidatus Liberibacter solanacearum TaxID=556287 RepID=A0A3R7NJ36_9HYPH|nr:UDP-N-acetylmuramate--L-alanine ligase [Candidatus Liberibacter solanacearum]RPD37220.1 UDP-N-acetylmuramate--L-alanine ligase [Candidatus Liberibacter solanacearum]